MARLQMVACKEPDVPEGPVVSNGANRKILCERRRKKTSAPELFRMINEIKEKEAKLLEDSGPAAKIGAQKRNVQEKGLAAVWRRKWPTWANKKIKTLLKKEREAAGEGV